MYRKVHGVSKKEQELRQERLLRTAVGRLPISVRVFEALAADQIQSLAALRRMTDEQLLKIKDLGKKGLRELRCVIPAPVNKIGGSNAD